MAGSDEAARGSPAQMLGFALLIGLTAVIAPVAAVRWPALLDYPNHYARMWLLAGGAELAPLSQMYRVSWGNTSTNVGIDLVAALLGNVLPVTAIGPLLVTAALVLPPLGAARLNAVAFGGLHWWQVVCLLLAWSTTFVAGFLNFQIGLGCALLGAALDPALARQRALVAALARLGIGALTLLVHPFALLFYGFLVGGLALGPRIDPLRSARAMRSAVARAVVACLPLLAPLVLLWVFASNLPGAHLDESAPLLPGAGGNPTIAIRLARVVWNFATPFVTYDVAVDAVFALALALPAAVALATRRLVVHAGLLTAALALALVSVAMPSEFAGTTFFSKRLPPMAVLAFAASVQPRLAPGARAVPVMLALALLAVTGRSLWVARIWGARQADVASVERALERLPVGAALLPVEHRPSSGDLSRVRDDKPGRYLLTNTPAYAHLATLAVFERYAFVPSVFSSAGKHTRSPARSRSPRLAPLGDTAP